jgi:energy-coupling factor transport system permease protein
MAVSGRRLSVTRYRPDRWAAAEWLVLASGLTVALATAYWAARDPAALGAPSGLSWPDLPLPYLGLLAVVAVPALAAPRPPAMSLAAPWAVGR